MKPYNGNPKILLCAKAKVHPDDVPGSRIFQPSKANECWGSEDQDPNPTAGEFTWGSYAPNAWMMSPKDGVWGGSSDHSDYWGKRVNVSSPYQVPLFLDSRWVDVWPRGSDAPRDEEWVPGTGGGSMSQLCLTRHGKATSIVFMDGSARRVPLIELWRLKWSKNFDLNNDYNTGVAQFPSWMK